MAIPVSYNFRNLLVRRTSTSAAALGIAMVVTIFILVLALAHGFARAVRTSGSASNAFILRKGATSEITSGLLRDVTQPIEVRPEIAKDASGRPLVVSELVALVVLPRRKDAALANVAIRGTRDNAIDVREGIRLLDGGRMFRSGLPEIVVGNSLARSIQGLGLGESVEFKRQRWTVVGVFDAGGTAFDSEIWGDVGLLQAAFRREEAFQSVTFRMADPAGFKALEASLEADPKFNVEVMTENQYYADQADMLIALIRILGTMITIILSLGAVLGAANTMYAAVGSRAREVATLRALGFGQGAVLVSFMFESLIISAAGGILGCILALPINGMTTSTTNWDTFSELSFAFRLTPLILASGFVFALVMGTAGGLLPALRAARLPITSGLRQG